MTTPLHQAISTVAQAHPAMVISAEVLTSLALNSLVRAAQFGKSTTVVIPSGHPAVFGRFKSMSIDPKQLKVDLVQSGMDTQVKIGPEFTLTLELFEPVGQLTYSIIELNVSGVAFPIRGLNNSIVFDPPEALVTAIVIHSPDRAAAINAVGISNDDLLRVEGSVAYGSGSRLVHSALGELDRIDLEQMFPAFRIGGDLKLHEVMSSLLIVPERFDFLGNTGCPKGDATNGMTVIPQTPSLGPDGGQWPINTTLPQPLALRTPYAGDGMAAAYLPKPVLDVHFKKIAPALTYRDQDKGFIGYNVEITAAIKDVVVTIDTAEFALKLELGFAAWGFTNATVDVPCVGRVELAQAHFSLPQNNRSSTIEVLVRLAVDTGGRLLMLSELTKSDLGDAEVSIQLFSKYLGMAGGKAAVVGFITDAVIGRVVANNLPGLVLEAIKAAVNQHFFVLADLSGLLKYFKYKPNTGTWSGDSDSVLLGLVNRG